MKVSFQKSGKYWIFFKYSFTFIINKERKHFPEIAEILIFLCASYNRRWNNKIRICNWWLIRNINSFPIRIYLKLKTLYFFTDHRKNETVNKSNGRTSSANPSCLRITCCRIFQLPWLLFEVCCFIKTLRNLSL